MYFQILDCTPKDDVKLKNVSYKNKIQKIKKSKWSEMVWSLYSGGMKIVFVQTKYGKQL